MKCVLKCFTYCDCGMLDIKSCEDFISSILGWIDGYLYWRTLKDS